MTHVFIVSLVLVVPVVAAGSTGQCTVTGAIIGRHFDSQPSLRQGELARKLGTTVLITVTLIAYWGPA